MTTLRDQILTHYRYGGQPHHTERLLTSVPLDVLHQAITDLLRSNIPSEFAETCFFIQDVVISTHTESAEKFREGVYASPVVSALEALVKYAPQYHARNLATYTLGKIWSVNSVGVMIEAFYRHFETDPLLVPRLLDEIKWLNDVRGAPQDRACMEEAAQNWNYLTRWAVVDHCYRAPDSLNIPCLEILAQDEHDTVRAEAQFALALTKNEAAMLDDWPDDEDPITPEREARNMILEAELDEISKSQPDLTFNLLEQRFWVKAKALQPYDYHLMELMQFADTMINNH